MSGAIIYTPSTGSDWATAWEQAEYTRKGKMGLSLTNYDNTSLPAIASGSWAEVAGSIYKWTSEEAISGSLSSSAVNYIRLVPSGSGDTAIVTATWTTTDPTWSDAYQGYYSSTSRYAAGCYYDGTYYNPKFIYDSTRESGKRDRHWSRAGHSVHILSYVQIDSSRVENTAAFDGYCYMPVHLPDKSRVIAISAYIGGNNLDASTIKLRYKDTDDTTWTNSDLTLSRTSGPTATESDTGSLIIDNENYDYEIEIMLQQTYSGYYAHVYNVHLTYEIYRD